MNEQSQDLKELLLQTDEEFHQLAAKHHELDDRLHELTDKPYLSEPEQLEEVTLKKRKLQLKDRMEDILRRRRQEQEPRRFARLNRSRGDRLEVESRSLKSDAVQTSDLRLQVTRSLDPPRRFPRKIEPDGSCAHRSGGVAVHRWARWRWRSLAGAGVAWWVALPFLVLAGFFLFFFRDPDRAQPRPIRRRAVTGGRPGPGRRPGASPEAAPPGDWQQISIFLSPMDVHVNRVPVSGRVTRVSFTPGRFLPAYRHDAGTVNERSEIWIDHDGQTIVARQIVGILARRVVCRLAAGRRQCARASATAS